MRAPILVCLYNRLLGGFSQSTRCRQMCPLCASCIDVEVSAYVFRASALLLYLIHLPPPHLVPRIIFPCCCKLKQHKFILSQSWRSEIQRESYTAKTKGVSQLFILESPGEDLFLFQLLETSHIYWLVATSASISASINTSRSFTLLPPSYKDP